MYFNLIQTLDVHDANGVRTHIQTHGPVILQLSSVHESSRWGNGLKCIIQFGEGNVF